MSNGNETGRKILRFLGFAARARKLVAGVPLLCRAMQRGGTAMPLVVIEAQDTSANTHKRVSDRTAYYGVPCYRIGVSAQALANAVGKRDGVIAAVGVTDASLAQAVLDLLAEESREQ